MIDKDTLSTALARISGAACSALVALSIVLYLDVTAQGYWYTFNSILGLAAFAELGAGQIIMRFVAAEIGARGRTETGKLRYMLHFTLRYGSMMSLGAVGLVAIAGGIWIGTSEVEHRPWELPWAVASLGAFLTMLGSFVFSYFEGWQLVARVNLARITVSVVTTAVTLGALAMGGQLYAFGASRVLAAAASLGFCLWLFRHVLADVRSAPASCPPDWRREFFALQKRYALTWVTGIFVTSIYLPVIFRVCGAGDSGRFGMSQALLNMIVLVATALVGGKQARMAALAANDVGELRAVFARIQSRSMILYGALSVGAFTAVHFSHYFVPGFADRLLSPVQLGALLVAGFFWLLIQNYTTFVRSFGREPFVRMAWAHALISGLSLFPATKLYGTMGAVGVSLLSNFVIALVARKIALAHLK